MMLSGCVPTPQFGCGSAALPCEVALGRYMIQLPKDWDGVSPIPAYVYFHGYTGTSSLVMASARHQTAVDDLGVIGIYPDGLDGAWSHHGAPNQRRDETAFVEQVIDDALGRLPIDRSRFIVTGFSIGGSMTWQIACEGPELGVLFAPVSGTLWEPLPASCESAALNLYHEHGTNDLTFPLQGRSIGGSWQQGDTHEAFAVMAQAQGCGEPVDEPWDHGTCQVWTGCSTGSELRLCVHDGGHSIRDGWHERLWQRVEALIAE
ncbi:MAG: polyhydroxybutyrate depolymerase [Kiritimatiellia bacterium]|jgi:polyhydroxybutyrate depolymerase